MPPAGSVMFAVSPWRGTRIVRMSVMLARLLGGSASACPGTYLILGFIYL
jgi:hypothetical protein